MKGASDGGLDISHSNKRFPGYIRDTKTFDASVHREHIMGGHVADYMHKIEEDDDEKYQKHFAKYIALNLEVDDLDESYENVYVAIREDPARAEGEEFTDIDKSFKKTNDQRKVDSNAKKASFVSGGDNEEEAEDEEDNEQVSANHLF